MIQGTDVQTEVSGLSSEDITRVGRFLGTNYVVTSNGRVFLTGRDEGTYEVKDGSVFSHYFNNFLRGSSGNGHEQLAEKIGGSNHLSLWEKINSRLPKNNLIVSGRDCGLDIEDMVTSATRERWNLMDSIERGDIEIRGYKEFHEGDFLMVPKKAEIWYGENGVLQHQLNPLTLMEDKDAIAGYREFHKGDFIKVTNDGRMFYGRNGTLECELNTSTLKEKKDEFISPSTFTGFGRGQGYGNGGDGRSRNDNKIILRDILDFYVAMLNVSCGDSQASEYRLNRNTKGKEWLDQLKEVGQTMTSFGEEVALRLSRKYAIENMDSMVSVYGNNNKQRARVVNRVLLEPNKSDGVPKTVMPKELPMMYKGTRNLPVIDTGTAVAHMLLGFVGTFAYGRH